MLRAAAAGLLTLCACAAADPVREAPMLDAMSRRPLLDGDGVVALPSDNPLRFHLRYRDGQVSVNDACAIRLENKLNPKIPPVYVNGRPIGFC